MRVWNRTRIVPALAFLLLLPATEHGQAAPPQNEAPSQKPIVILELFTSEGCSSCPPADQLVRKISELQPVSGVEVVAMEEHVDYWNHDGWTDPFSSPDFTERQVTYSHILPKSGVYTPEMVVDGSTEITGTQPQQTGLAIQKAASIPKARVVLTPSAEKVPGRTSFGVKVAGLPSIAKGEELELWIAVTEKDLQSDVTAGENSGKTLPHAPVVRSIQKAGSTRNGNEYQHQVTLKLEKKWKPENLIVVAIVVDKNSRKIVGVGIAPVE